jgi:hypothetical protein
MSIVSGLITSSAEPSRWDITPLCGSTNLDHVQEALAIQNVDGLKKDDPEVQALLAAMRKAGGK